MADVRRPRDRVESAVIRAWAKDNWPDPLAERGRIPPGVRAAFEEAHGQPVEVEDVSAMDETGLDEDLAEPVEGEPAGWVYAGSSGPVEFMAPPLDLDEARERAGRDPEPAHLIRGRKRGSARPAKDKQPPPKVTKAVRDDITGKVAFWLLIPAEPWRRADPYCGQAYADCVDEIAVKMTPLLCLSPDIVRWFGKSTTFLMWTELAMACRPVAEAVIAHHVTKRITLDSNGQTVEVKRGGMDFSAYSARQPNPAAAA